MDSFHINECVHAKLKIKPCGLELSHQHSLSCMLPWFDHLKECNTCLTHILPKDSGASTHNTYNDDDNSSEDGFSDRDTEVNLCSSKVCAIISELWALRSCLIEFLIVNKLLVDGYIFGDIMTTLNQLFKLDYENIHYVVSKKVLVPDRNTDLTFTVLTYFVFTKSILMANGLSLGGPDLSYLLKYIYEHELLPYFGRQN